MAYGDVGGAVVQLVITCAACPSSDRKIEKHDPVCLTGPYEVNNIFGASDGGVFGEALSDGDDGEAIPVKVRGISIFQFTGSAPSLGGQIIGSIPGAVQSCERLHPQGVGTVLKVNEGASEVHVLL